MVQQLASKKNFNLTVLVIWCASVSGRRELFEYLMHTGLLGEELARTIFLQVARAIEYIHNEGIAHRNIKPEDIVFDSKFKAKVTLTFLAIYLSPVSNTFLLGQNKYTECCLKRELLAAKL